MLELLHLNLNVFFFVIHFICPPSFDLMLLFVLSIIVRCFFRLSTVMEVIDPPDRTDPLNQEHNQDL